MTRGRWIPSAALPPAGAGTVDLERVARDVVSDQRALALLVGRQQAEDDVRDDERHRTSRAVARISNGQVTFRQQGTLLAGLALTATGALTLTYRTPAPAGRWAVFGWVQPNPDRYQLLVSSMADTGATLEARAPLDALVNMGVGVHGVGILVTLFPAA